MDSHIAQYRSAGDCTLKTDSFIHPDEKYEKSHKKSGVI